MKNFPRVLLGTVLCLALSAPVAMAADTGSFLVAAAASKKKTAPAKEPADLGKALDQFAHKTAESINRCILPCITKKEVKRNPDGSFTARYIAIDPQTIKTSYKPAEDASSPVKYIGYMSYEEVEYVSTAPSKAAAEKGSFMPKKRESMTELVKYTKGKWTY